MRTQARSRNELLVKTCDRSLEVQSFSGSRAGKNAEIACVLINTQSLRSKFDEFQCFVEKPDITCVTETWVSEGFNGIGFKTLKQLDMISFPTAEKHDRVVAYLCCHCFFVLLKLLIP